MNISEQTIVGELVAQNYRTASIFKSNGIDFCCNGNRSIAEACAKKEIDTKTLISALEQAMAPVDAPATNYNFWPLDLLADYIEKKHHRYVTAKILEITPFLQKVTRVHGERHPELKEVQALFDECCDELTIHMKKEEVILFPYIRRMAAATTYTPAPFGPVQNPIRMMTQEHSDEGKRFRKIAALTNNYTPPEDACGTYRVTFSLLKEFEEDLHLHIHLENNILFPKAISQENELSSQQNNHNSCRIN